MGITPKTIGSLDAAYLKIVINPQISVNLPTCSRKYQHKKVLVVGFLTAITRTPDASRVPDEK